MGSLTNDIFKIYGVLNRDQKPIAQYIELKKKSTFLFCNFILQINIFANLFLLILLIIFKQKEILFLLLTIFLITFLICQNLYKSFTNAKILYEEYSWFDSQIWEKPIFLLKNDKLFSNQKIKKELKSFYRIIIIFFLSSLLLLV